jgi:hypothetical protein
MTVTELLKILHIRIGIAYPALNLDVCQRIFYFASSAYRSNDGLIPRRRNPAVGA